MTVTLMDERALRLRVEYLDVARFLTTYWPTDATDDATALHAMLSTARAADVSWWRQRLLLFLLSSADDADKAAFVRMSARRRFQTERAQDALTWLGRWPWRCWISRTTSPGSPPARNGARRQRAEGAYVMIRQSSLPARRRPMAIKVSAAHAVPRRPALRLRWSWLLLAALLLALATLLALVLVH